jgi:hypothetical protein
VKREPEDLLDRLVSRDAETRRIAQLEAKTLDASQLRALMQSLKAAECRRTVVLYTLIVLGYAVVVAVLCGWIPLRMVLSKDASGTLLMLSLFWPMVVLLFPAPRRRAVTRVLEGIEDSDCLPALLHVLAVQDVADRAAMRLRLKNTAIRLLNTMRAEAIAGWSAEDRKALRTMLAFYAYQPLRMAVLRVLERAGDESDIPAVTSLIARNQHPKTDEDRELVEAAKRCLEYLAVRKQEEQQVRTLLRGSQRDAASPAELLRAAKESNDVALETLLRASGSVE